MNTNKQTNIDTIIELFAALSDTAQSAFMSVLRLDSAIRAGVLPDDAREPVMRMLADAFDRKSVGVLT